MTTGLRSIDLLSAISLQVAVRSKFNRLTLFSLSVECTYHLHRSTLKCHRTLATKKAS